MQPHKGFNMQFHLKLWPFHIRIAPFWLVPEHDDVVSEVFLFGVFAFGYTHFIDQLAEGWIFQLVPPQHVHGLNTFKHSILWRWGVKSQIEKALND